MGRRVENPNFFTAGGPLSSEAPSYVQRPADDELLRLITNGQFAYVFAPYHMGKSSLMLRTVCQLQRQEIKAVTVDLDGFDPTVDSEQIYLFVLKRLNFQLQLSIDPAVWWLERAALNSKQRFVEFLHDVLLAQIGGKIVVFIDGINSVSSQVDFFEDFFSAIHTIYQTRSTDPVYNRLNFVLLGTAIPEVLVKDQAQSPFKLGQPVNLSDFNRTEAGLLEQGLQASCSDEVGPVFDRIFYWTNGHPYLTQKLCLNVARMWDGHWNAERVDGLVERLFTSSAAVDEPHLWSITETIQAHPKRRQLFRLYRQIYKGKAIRDEEQSPEKKWLKVIGLVRSENGVLRGRNLIYRLAFDLEWMKANSPANVIRYTLLAVIVFAILAIGIVGYSIRESQRTAQAQVFVQNFREATRPETRIINLADLFNLGGFDDEAQALFYDELSPADQRALFEQVDPFSVGAELVVVVKGLYADPTLRDEPQGNDLLRVMTQPLKQLESSPSLGAIELELEITQWLRGREEYYTQGQYQRAIDAYNIALTMNDRNPGTYYDRGLAYAALGDSSRAFADFATVLSIDDNWQLQVEQGLINDPQLYTALWREPGEYGALIALVPTPTNTPIPTQTPTSTPTPTPTSTPVTPTSTPTNVPTVTPPPTSTPTANVQNLQPIATRTATPAVPTGNLTLLAPTHLDIDSYGPTDFKWRWVGTLPPGYGFEVRVWREGEPPVGAHNAIMDNQNGNIKSMGDNTYELDTNITDAAGVKGRGGIYLWTVAVVQISPEYADLGLQAEPAQLEFVPLGGGSSGGGGGSSGEGGGGVGID